MGIEEDEEGNGHDRYAYLPCSRESFRAVSVGMVVDDVWSTVLGT